TGETKYDEFIEKNEAFLYVFRGGIEVSNNGIDPRVVKAGECLILSGGKSFQFRFSEDNIALLLKSTTPHDC
ncbi:hypothetical protein Pmar_PMAR012841, partial [Perkinsus marinus ATCC 50983]